MPRAMHTPNTPTRASRPLVAAAGLAGLTLAGCSWVGSREYEWAITEPSTPTGQARASADPHTPPTLPARINPGSAPIASSRADSLATLDASPTANDASFAMMTAGEAPPASAPSPSDDTPPLTITQVTFATEGSDFDPCLFPDGRSLVFASTQHRETADLYVKAVDSKVVTQLTRDPGNDVMPAVSPDGSKIAFASDRNGNWDLYLMPAGGGQAVQITTDPADELHPSWSPDGKHLVFCRLGSMSGRWELWVHELENQAVTHFVGYGMFPQWCPMPRTGESLGAGISDKILFQRGRERGERAFGIWTVDYKDGRVGNATNVASSSDQAFINPAWSPDGTKIVYASVPNPSDWPAWTRSRPASAQLWMLNSDGSGRVRLTTPGDVALMPAWGKNSRLYYVSARSGRDTVWSLDIEPAVRAAMLPGLGELRTARGTSGTAPAQDAATPSPTAPADDGVLIEASSSDLAEADGSQSDTEPSETPAQTPDEDPR